MEMMMITEVEMREFFDRVVQQVNQLTGTAQEVEGLHQRINELADRVRSLEETNRNLQQQLDQAQRSVTSLEASNTEHLRELDNERAVTANLREVIVTSDNRVASLTNDVKSETDAHRITRADLDDARRAISEWETKYNQANDAFISASVERDEWRNRANSLDRDNAELKSKLDGISAMLNPPAFHVVGGDGSGQAQVG